MPIPDYQSLLAPVLRVAVEEGPCSLAEARDSLAKRLELTPDDLEARISRGRSLWSSRFGWAKTYLGKAGALDTHPRGQLVATERGRQLLADHPDGIDNATLTQFEEFTEWTRRSRAMRRRPSDEAVEADREAESVLSPREALESSYAELRAEVADELLSQVLMMTPFAFEGLVLKLMERLGYGVRPTSYLQTTASGDEGVDGIVYDDALGLEVICLQAKRWAPDRSVGRPDIQAFAGSLDGQRARKGVFITTSSFADTARAYVERIEKRIVLIDGAELVGLMFDSGLGVSVTETFALKDIDTDFFSED